MDLRKLKAFICKVMPLILVLTFATLSYLCTMRSIPNVTYSSLTGDENDFIGELIRGCDVEQDIPYSAGDLGISLKFAAYARKNLGKVNIRVKGILSDFVYVNESLDANRIADNAYIDFDYAVDRPMKDETLKIEISSTSRKGQGVTVAIRNSDDLQNYSLKKDGEVLDADLAVRVIVPFYWRNIVWVIYGLSVVCILLTFFMVLRNQINLEKTYFVSALCLGIVYCIVITPLSIPDEYYHYNSSLRMSNILCFQWNNPETVDEKYFDFHDISGHYNTSIEYKRIYNEFFLQSSKEKGEQVNLGGGIDYPPMVIPPAIGLSIGRILNTNFLMTYYLGRLTNLLFYIGCVYCAIKKTPRFKLLFFLIGIMPMSLHQAASYSYDAYINGMALLLVGYILSVIDGKEILHFKDLLPVAMIGAFLAPAKVVYSSLLLLLLLVPQKRFLSRKSYFQSIGFAFISAVIVIAVFQLTRIVNLSTRDAAALNWEGGVNYNIGDILHDPWKFAFMFYNTFTQSVWGWFVQCIGKSFCGLTMAIDDLPIVLYGALMMIASFRYENERATENMERSVYMVAFFASVIMIMLAMLFDFTSNTRDIVAGIQGRYFIPVISLFYMSLNNRLISIRKPIEKYVIVMGVLTNLCILEQVVFKTLTL